MLVKFEIENFRSFRKNQIFHTIQRKFKRFSQHVFNYSDDLKLLKTSGIYGGNASGKTNLFKGLCFVKMMVQNHEYLNSLDSKKLFSPFRLDQESELKDSVFQVDFISHDTLYMYELNVSKKQNKVTLERLSIIVDDEQKVIFERFREDDNQIKLIFPYYSEAESLIEPISRLIPPHSTLLSLELFTDGLIANARDWFVNKAQFQFPDYEFGDIAFILAKDKEYLELANRIVNFSKTGVNRLKIDSIPIEVYLGAEKSNMISHISSVLEDKEFHSFKDAKGSICTAVRESDELVVLKLTTMHFDNNGEEVNFEPDQESRGTIALLHLLPVLILSYFEGVNYFIDEIGSSLHPVLLREILAQYFNNNIEHAKGQLIFNTHEDFIMDEKIIRQDEIWLVEKENGNGETTIFPLSDIRNIRFDLNLKKNYLNGKFGGVPFKSKPDKLIFDVQN